VKIPLRWLREFVDSDAPAAELAERLTMAGIEAGVLPPATPALAGVVVGEVLEVAPHPSGGSLRLCRVSTGRDRFQVVCGAPNVRAGARAAFAPPGAELPGGRRIAVAAIRGVPSEGMLCSEAELALGEDAGGILLLEAAAPVGADLAGHLGLDDTVLEVEVTPNRPDCLAIAGIAREVAALTGARFRPPDVGVDEDATLGVAGWSVVVGDEELCPRYAARVVAGVTVAPSPAWLAQRLRAAGLRPINNVVDVTNYVLWELGHPLHAFDGDLLADRRVVVRRARSGETLVTLDGQGRTLTEAMLVIADADRAVAVAGVMGGANSEVHAGTRTVLLESACFKPASVRRTAKTLGLATEASYRFERGADIEGLRQALDRAASLIARLAGGRVARGVLDAYPRPRPRVTLSLRLARVRQVAGACPPPGVAAGILRGLGLGVEPAPGGFQVSVPSFRRDIAIEDDLVEEIVRVWGYGEIPSAPPGRTAGLVRRPRHLAVEDVVRRTLAAAGCHEAISLALVDPALLPPLGLAPDDPRAVRLRNPLAADRSVLRPTLLAGLLEALATNVRRQAADVRLFEIGRVFESRGPDAQPHEETRVAIAMTGLRGPRTWFGGRARVDVFDAKGAAEAVVEALGRGEVTVDATEAPYLEEGRGAALLVGGMPVGVVGELHPAVQRAFDLPAPAFVAELSLDRLEALPGRAIAYRTLGRHPGVSRDLAVVVARDVPAAEVGRALRAIPSPFLRRAELFDVYEGTQVGAGRRSLAYALLYQADDRTLTDGEVNAMHAEVIERLRADLGAEVRGADGGGA
jgi:phenylalanyl-tRNA synthetase beta chain